LVIDSSPPEGRRNLRKATDDFSRVARQAISTSYLFIAFALIVVGIRDPNPLTWGTFMLLAPVTWLVIGAETRAGVVSAIDEAARFMFEPVFVRSWSIAESLALGAAYVAVVGLSIGFPLVALYLLVRSVE
jgi:hypothetical protein